jgi:hypothetical protein
MINGAGTTVIQLTKPSLKQEGPSAKLQAMKKATSNNFTVDASALHNENTKRFVEGAKSQSSQASSRKIQAPSNKRQAPSPKVQAPSRKRQAP